MSTLDVAVDLTIQAATNTRIGRSGVLITGEWFAAVVGVRTDLATTGNGVFGSSGPPVSKPAQPNRIQI